MNAKTMLMFAAGAAASLAMADGLVPSVSNVSMAQTAHSRNVTITYDLADAAAVVTLDVQTNRTGAATNDDADWISLGGTNVCNATGDVWKKVETGSRTITWSTDKSWRGFKVSAARAVVTAWSVDNPPDYMVVNIAANAEKSSERYYPSAEFLPGGLLTNPDYRTSKIVLRKIPAKDVEWTMGSNSLEPGHDSGTEKMIAVSFTNNYYIAVFETTQTQWSLIFTSYPTPSKFKTEGTMRPVDQVPYNDIRNVKANSSYDYPAAPDPNSFLGILRDKTGLLFDLPSEAQWEFACRAGHGIGYWGDGSPILSADEDTNLARLGRVRYTGGKVKDSSGAWQYPDASVGPTNGTAIVGSYAPNSWGLYDMHGNVWEWCLDLYAADISSLGGAVNTTASGTDRVLRGGAFGINAEQCRAAKRGGSAAPSKRDQTFGFRIVLPLSTAAE